MCVTCVWPSVQREHHYKYMRTLYLDSDGGHEGCPTLADLLHPIIVENNGKTFPMQAVTTINNTRLCQLHAVGGLS